MAFLGRITRVHVMAAGCVVFLAVGVVAMVVVFKSRLETLRNTRMEVNNQISKATPDEFRGALLQLAQAHDDFLLTRGKFDAILAKQPKITVTDGNQAAFDLWREYGPTGTGTILINWFLSRGYEAKGIAVPAPPLPPVQVPPLIAIQMSGFGIRFGSFPAAMNFLKNTSKIPRLFMITGANVSGRSGAGGALEVPLPATVFIITKNAIGITTGTGTPLGAAPTATGVTGPSTSGGAAEEF